MKHVNRLNFFSHHRVAVLGLAVLAMMGAAVLGTASSLSSGRAQTASCASATLIGQAESGGTLAFVDVGVGKVALFVCIDSTEFPGGQGGPFTANGTVASGCFVIDGLGTDVVAVFREDPAIAPGCEALVSIRVGLQGTPATPTVSALTPTATATSVTSTATAPASTATVTRTSVPATSTAVQSATSVATATRTSTIAPTSVATSPAVATATPIRPTVIPPKTGSGSSGSGGSNLPLLAGIAIMMIVAGAGAVFVGRKNERNRS